MHRWIVRGLVLAIALISFVACSSDEPAADGGGEPSPGTPVEAAAAPGDYAEGLCSAIVSYQTDLEAEQQAFEEEFSAGTPTPQETKDVLVSFLDRATERTQQLIDEVNALGTPDVDNGEEVRSTLTSAFEQVVDLFDSARSEIEALPVDDPAALAEGLTSAGTKLQEAATGISSSFDEISSPELDEAAANAPSCDGVI